MWKSEQSTGGLKGYGLRLCKSSFAGLPTAPSGSGDGGQQQDPRAPFYAPAIKDAYPVTYNNTRYYILAQPDRQIVSGSQDFSRVCIESAASLIYKVINYLPLEFDHCIYGVSGSFLGIGLVVTEYEGEIVVLVSVNFDKETSPSIEPHNFVYKVSLADLFSNITIVGKPNITNTRPPIIEGENDEFANYITLLNNTAFAISSDDKHVCIGNFTNFLVPTNSTQLLKSRPIASFISTESGYGNSMSSFIANDKLHLASASETHIFAVALEDIGTGNFSFAIDVNKSNIGGSESMPGAPDDAPTESSGGSGDSGGGSTEVESFSYKLVKANPGLLIVRNVGALMEVRYSNNTELEALIDNYITPYNINNIGGVFKNATEVNEKHNTTIAQNRQTLMTLNSHATYIDIKESSGAVEFMDCTNTTNTQDVRVFVGAGNSVYLFKGFNSSFYAHDSDPYFSTRLGMQIYSVWSLYDDQGNGKIVMQFIPSGELISSVGSIAKNETHYLNDPCG